MKMSFQHFDPEQDVSMDTVQITIIFGMNINGPRRMAVIDLGDFFPRAIRENFAHKISFFFIIRTFSSATLRSNVI